MAGARGREAFTYHGGGLDVARAAYPRSPAPWIDLSTGINPVAYPVPALDPALWAALPEAAATARLEAAAARAFGTTASRVVAAPGTQAVIGVLPRLRPAPRVGVLGLTYGEHARAWGGAGATVETVATLRALEGFDAAVVVNPNNPDGRRVAVDDLVALAARVGLLVVDEAFVDVLPPGASVVAALPPRVAVLRSFGKTYGLAGLRLGFAVTAEDLASDLRATLGPWRVSGPAVAIGCAALDDAGWRAAATARLARDAARLDALLESRGAAIVGGTPLFRLAAVDDAARWFEHLAGAGILVRPFATRPGWLRFGIPGIEDHWRRLAAALPRLTPRPNPAPSEA